MNTTKKPRRVTKKKAPVNTTKKRSGGSERIDLLGDVRRSAARGPLDTRAKKAAKKKARATRPVTYVDTDSVVTYADHARIAQAQFAQLMRSSIYGKFGHNPTKALLGQLDALREEGGAVVHPKHYNSHPSGVECIAIVEHMTFNTGSAVKYCWRAGLKVDEGVALTVDAADTEALARIKDLEKARWFLSREIEKLTKEQTARVKKRLNESFGAVGAPPVETGIVIDEDQLLEAARKKRAPAKKAARARKKGRA